MVPVLPAHLAREVPHPLRATQTPHPAACHDSSVGALYKAGSANSGLLGDVGASSGQSPTILTVCEAWVRVLQAGLGQGAGCRGRVPGGRRVLGAEACMVGAPHQGHPLGGLARVRATGWLCPSWPCPPFWATLVGRRDELGLRTGAGGVPGGAPTVRYGRIGGQNVQGRHLHHWQEAGGAAGGPYCPFALTADLPQWLPPEQVV